jgi:regulator of sigma E protease
VVFAVMFGMFGRYVAEPMVAEVRPGSPAAESGIEPGDRFISVDGVRIETFGDVQRVVSGRAGDPLTFVLERNGQEITVVATPEATEQQDALGNTIRIGIIGVVNNEALGQPRHVEYGPIEAVGAGVSETVNAIARTGQFLKRLVAGREDRCQLGGPVKIADMAGRAASLGFEWLVQLVALLSVGIGILNLLPIPPLDGGHLVFYAVEAVLRRPVPEQVVEVVYRAGMLMVLIFMGFVFWNDLFGC